MGYGGYLRNSIKEGKGVIEMKDSKAKEEMENLFKELISLLNLRI